jgi:hypothetical protein
LNIGSSFMVLMKGALPDIERRMRYIPGCLVLYYICAEDEERV